MSANYLLDTSVVVEIMKRNATVLNCLAATGSPYLSAVALGELMYGAKHSANPPHGLTDVDAATQHMTLLAVDRVTADLFSDIKHDLRTRGQMIPDNDIWIAATAIQYGLTLTSRDAHFAWVVG